MYVIFTSLEREDGFGIVGSVAQLNMWLYKMPLPALIAMSRGINAIGSKQISWESLMNSFHGNVEKIDGNIYYLTGTLL